MRGRSAALRQWRDKFLLSASADRAGGATASGVRWWCIWCLFVRGISPIRTVDESSPRRAKLEEEELLMDFCTWLVMCRPSGKSIAPKTAQKYVYTIQSWHRRQPNSGGRIGGGMELSRWQGLIRGMRRELGDPAKRKRYGCRTQQLSEALEQELSGGTTEEIMWRAALATGFCGLLRGGEFALQRGEEFDEINHLSRADLSFFRDGGGVLHAVLRLRVLKSEESLRGKTQRLVLREGGTLLDPVRELWRMVRADPVPKEERESTPLFRHAASRAPITVEQVRDMVKRLMTAVGCDAAFFGAHSLRIGGATAALAAGVDPSVIRAMGRWASDVFEIYTRLTREAAARFTTLVGSTAFHDVERVQSEALDDLVDVGALPLPLDVDMDEDEGEDE